MPRPYARDIEKPCDPLGETLYLLRLNGSLYCQSELFAPWGMEMPAMPGKMMFHIVTSGNCWLSVEGHAKVHLPAGSLALVPKGQGHYIFSDDGVDCDHLFDIPVTQISERYEFLRHGGNGQHTALLCGVMSFDQIEGGKLVDQLPSVIHLNHSNTELGSWLEQSIRFISAEALEKKAGGETIMAHLADIIVIQAIRHWIEQTPEAQQGWLGALRDPKLGKALTAIHSSPSAPWTVDELAKTAGMSRSGFSARFTDTVGMSVKHYLTHWRMHLAKAKLQSKVTPLGDLAEELGYQSEAAFSRAYKRIMGESPVRRLK